MGDRGKEREISVEHNLGLQSNYSSKQEKQGIQKLEDCLSEIELR